MMHNIYKKKKLLFFIFTIITLILLFIGKSFNLGQNANARYHIYSIVFEYFGMDSAELEKQITIPLEDKINSIAGLTQMRSVTENGCATVTVWFPKSQDAKKIYLSIRNIVDTLYLEMPKAVQKPRIYSAESDARAVFSFTISSQQDLPTLKKYIETTLKKKFESIDGVADVVVAGGANTELNIEFDPEHLVAENLNPQIFSQIVQDANVVFSGIDLYTPLRDITIQFNTKLQTVDQIKKLPIKLKEEYTNAGSLASINFDTRKQEEIVRINGKEALCVQIKAASDGNSIKISQQCKKLLSSSEILPDDYTIITDEGEIQTKLLKDVVYALLQSFICVIILIPLFYTSMQTAGILLLCIPFTALWTLCQLTAAGLNIDRNCLAGLSISIGLIADPMLVIAESADRCKNSSEFSSEVQKNIPPLMAATLTSLLALIPLYNTEYIIPGIQSIITTIALMLCNSIIIACVFFPCYVYAEHPISLLPQKFQLAVQEKYAKLPEKIIRKSLQFSKSIHILYILLIFIPCILFFLLGKNITYIQKQDIVYASIEYPPERKASHIDTSLQEFIKEAQKINGVTFVRSECKTGKAEFEIGFKKNITTSAAIGTAVQQLSALTADGFIYIPADSNTSKQAQLQEFEIAAAGDESAVCKNLAETAVEYISQNPYTAQAVLNFKQNSKEAVFAADRNLMARNNINTNTIATTLHWMLFGPVIDKWLRNNTEYDIRVSGAGLKTADLQTFKNIYIPTEQGGVPLSSVGNIFIQDSNGKIYRLNGRRCAFFTIQSTQNSTSKAVKTIQDILSTIEIPKGYSFQFSHEIAEMNAHYSQLAFLCIFTIALIYIFMAGLTENFLKAILIISIIPVSSALY